MSEQAWPHPQMPLRSTACLKHGTPYNHAAQHRDMHVLITFNTLHALWCPVTPQARLMHKGVGRWEGGRW